MRKYAVVKKSCLMVYGSINKAWVSLRRGQKWELIHGPSLPQFPWYTIKRNDLVIDVMQGEYRQYFEEVKDVRKV